MDLPVNRRTPFFEQLYAYIEDFGGLFNAHLHLDRALTLGVTAPPGQTYDPTVHVSLHEKHRRIADIHAGPAYDLEKLEARVDSCLDAMVACGTVRADTMVDVSDDRVGLTALDCLSAIRDRRRGEIDLRVASYTPFGFTDDRPQRWDLMVEGAKRADFLGFLPEADDRAEYPDHIGFKAHCHRALDLAMELDKPAHVHLDQRNEPSERGAEQLLEAVAESRTYSPPTGEPLIWGVHMISPTTYDEGRFAALVDGLKAANIGVICCPTAAIGMRQLRPIQTPTDNCFPRVLDFLAAGIPVRLASDNIADACSPSTTADLVDEVIVLSGACRFYDPRVLARLACGQPLEPAELETVRHHLAENAKQVARTLEFLG